MKIRFASALLLALSLLAAPASAQPRKDAVVLGMTLEPPGLDPTAGAASAIAEVVLYNVFETLTKVNGDGSITPLLAEGWDTAVRSMCYEDGTPVEIVVNGNPYRRPTA